MSSIYLNNNLLIAIYEREGLRKRKTEYIQVGYYTVDPEFASIFIPENIPFDRAPSQKVHVLEKGGHKGMFLKVRRNGASFEVIYHGWTLKTSLSPPKLTLYAPSPS